MGLYWNTYYLLVATLQQCKMNLNLVNDADLDITPSYNMLCQSVKM